MLNCIIGRKHAAIHKYILNCEALKAGKARTWTLKNIWRDVNTISFRVGLFMSTGVSLREELTRDTQRRKLEVKRT